MSDLSRHLVEPGSHSRLTFHAACPVCIEERLAGALDDQSLVPPRARAGLAAALLATSAIPPIVGFTAPAAVAEDDQEQGGAVEPGAGAPADADGTDAGGDSGADTPLGDEQSAAGVGTGDDDSDAEEGGPLEDVPPERDDPPPVDDHALQRQTVPPTGPHPRAGADPHPNGGNELGGGDGSGQSGLDTKPADKDRTGPPNKKDEGDKGSTRRHAPAAAQPTVPLGSTAHVNGSGALESEAPTTAQTAGPVTSSTPAASAVRVNRAERDSGLHVVRPGESLWSIATALLGSGATSAEVASEVSRLWTINAEAIGTGDPDLVMVGQRLRLR